MYSLPCLLLFLVFLPRVDLTNEMTKLPTDARLDPASERKVINAITDRLDKDSSLDVQAIAVKSLSILVTHISENGISDTCDKLMNQVIYGRAELQDVYAIGLKTIITQVPNYDNIGYAILKSIVPKLVKDGLVKPIDTTKRNDVRTECLEISQELVRKFGDRMNNELAQLTKMYIDSLLDTNPIIRKRTTAVIGIIAGYLNDQLLEELINTLLSYIEKRNKGGSSSSTSGAGKVTGAEATRTIIQTIGTVSRQVRHRLGRHLQRIVPLFLDYLGTTEAALEDESLNNETANELRENILTAFESFFGAMGTSSSSSGDSHPSSSGQESLTINTDSTLATFRETVINACLSWMTFDPNYFYGDDNDNDDSTAIMVNDEDNDMEGEDYGDDDGFEETDDDTSWKSRRAAVRVLMGISNAVMETPGTSITSSLVPASAPALHQLMLIMAVPIVKRIKEREEGVRLDVINAVTAFVLANHYVLGKLADTTRDKTSASSGGNVSMDIDSLLTGLGYAALPLTAVQGSSSSSSSGGALDGAPLSRQLSGGSTNAVTEAINTTSTDIHLIVPLIVKGSLVHLRAKDAKSVKTRGALLHLLRTIIVILDTEGGNLSIGSGAAYTTLSPFLPALIPVTLNCMRDRTQAQSASLRYEASQFLHALLLSFSRYPPYLAPYFTNIVNQLVDSSKDDYYRIVALTMRNCAITATLLRPVSTDASSMLTDNLSSSQGTVTFADPLVPNGSTLYKSLVQAVLPRLQSHDIDQEIKDGAIVASATILAHAGNVPEVDSQKGTILQLFNERIKSDNTRIQVLRSLGYIASSPLHIDIATALNTVVIECGNFMRQISRPLRVQTLTSLISFLSTQGTKLDIDNLRKVCEETASTNTMTDSDLHMCHLAFEMGSTIIRIFTPEQATELLSDTILKRGIELSSSPVLQGSALDSLTTMLRTGVTRKLSKDFQFSSLIAALVTRANGNVSSRTALVSIANCIAAVLSAVDTKVNQPLLKSFLKDATTLNGTACLPSVSSTNISHPLLSRLVISETSRCMDIFSLDTKIVSSLISTLRVPAASKTGATSGSSNVSSSTSVTTADELQYASALAIGGVIAANMNTGLGELLQLITGDDQSSSLYPLLQSLREALQRHAPMTIHGPSLHAHLPNITKVLLSSSLITAKDDGLRTVVAECLGRVIAADPVTVLPLIIDQTLSESQLTRWTAIVSIKYCVGFPGAYNSLIHVLPDHLYKLFNTLVDADIGTRAAAFGTLNTLIHSAPLFLRKLLLPVGPNRIPISLTITPPATTATLVAGTTAPKAPTLTAPVWPHEGLLVPIYYETQPHPELIRKIFLGPFTHIVDDGLAIRKGAFTCIESLISCIPEVLQTELIPSLLVGMRDASDDIRILAQSSFSKACEENIIKRLLVTDQSLLDHILNTIEYNLVSTATPAPNANPNTNPSSSSSSGPEVLSDNARLTLRSFDKLLKMLPVSYVTSNKRLMELIELCEHREPMASVFATIRAEK